VFTAVAPYYDVASNLASLGLFNWWGRRFVSFIEVAPGDSVLDVCSGTNAVGIGLLRRQPDLWVFALDRNAAMQAVGDAKARSLGFDIKSIINDAHELPFPDDCFDVVTLQWSSRHLQVVDAFLEIRRVLKPGGRFYHCDMSRPESRPLEVLYSAYLRACVTITGLIFQSGSDAWHCRDYFVRTLRMFYSARELTDLLRNIGFSEVSDRRAPGGIMAYHKAVKA
jgi:demethylmenaquinone methyltransferase/2-methoxy-6-polyprenyl-1,4-benzoquinol methylase